MVISRVMSENVIFVLVVRYIPSSKLLQLSVALQDVLAPEFQPDIISNYCKSMSFLPLGIYRLRLVT